jgi:acetyltransferase-like isoleucine patch superfamily enzyme
MKPSIDPRAVLLGDDIEIGENSRIDAFAVITGHVRIGRYVHIGVGAFISGANGPIEMADFSAVSPGAKVFSGSDDYSGRSMTNPTVPMELKLGLVTGPVSIGKHCLVGANAVILPNTVMREGSCVGAMSMARGELAEAWVYAGVPARQLKERDRDYLELEKELE